MSIKKMYMKYSHSNKYNKKKTIKIFKLAPMRDYFLSYSGKLVYMFGSYITRQEPTYYVILP